MYKYLLITYIALVALFAYLLYAEEKLLLKNKAFVSTDSVKISDLVSKKGKYIDKPIFKTPEAPSVVTAEELNQYLQEEYEFTGKECILIPLNKEFQPQEIMESLQAEIHQRNQIPIEEFRLKYEGNTIRLPGKEVEFRWSSFPKNIKPGKRMFSLDVYWNNKKLFSQKLFFVLEKKMDVLVTTKPIPTGYIFKEEDVRKQSIYTIESGEDLIQSGIIGYTSIGSLSEGSVIRRKQIKKYNLVEKGAIINVVYSNKSLYISTQGKAEETGNTGDKIKVRILNNQKIIYGIIIDPYTIRID